MCAVRNGVRCGVPVRVAGELRLRLAQPSVHTLDASAGVRLRVVAAPAVTIDVTNVPEQVCVCEHACMHTCM